MEVLSIPLADITGLDPAVVQALAVEFGLTTVGEALWWPPLRYNDRSVITPIGQLRAGALPPQVQVMGAVDIHTHSQDPRRRRLVATLRDETGVIELVWFKRVTWIYERLRIGGRYVAFGQPSLFGTRLTITHPEMHSLASGQPPTLGVEPVYSSSKYLRKAKVSNAHIAYMMQGLLKFIEPSVAEYLPDDLLERYRLPRIGEALRWLHMPSVPTEAEAARRRLKFDELLLHQLNLLDTRKERLERHHGACFEVVGDLFNALYKALPFDLTNAQKRVIREMRHDMNGGHQMNRLLQGDVGSGKTLVALFCLLLAVDNGYQGCLVAPTEILAAQHYANIVRYTQGMKLRVWLLTGSTSQKERRGPLTDLAGGAIDIIVGTHALMEEPVQFSKLGLVVVDEQHRFGVAQRASLWRKANDSYPHVLVMTATPIPRTLAMTTYGDLDISTIDELPPGRQPIETLHIFDTRRSDAYERIATALLGGRQAYVVYPLIEESEKVDLASLQEGFAALTDYFAPRYTLTMLHGRMSGEEKRIAMDRFKSGEVHIMVSTTVIEVGVDVPNATIMLIESAQRFGLSQLHQLRGRVGRGEGKSTCILLTPYQLAEATRKRMEVMVESQDGFRIAEADLLLRGPGDVQGTAQSGVGCNLRIANISTDAPLLRPAREEAMRLLESYPPEEREGPLWDEVRRRYATRTPFGSVG